MRSHRAPTTWLGIDVGGANLKAAHSLGTAISRPFELWRNPRWLSDALRELATCFPPFDHLAVTMTGELCDCFSTKAEGVTEILLSTRAAFPATSTHIWGLDGQFHSIDEVLQNPHGAAAANWLALATCVARRFADRSSLLIDLGSTTTDITALQGGRPRPAGKTDTERLINGELVYAGVRRTPVCAIANELPWRDAAIGLCAEWFATTLDVYLMLGAIAPNPTDTATADSRPATPELARNRLARMVGADETTFSMADAIAVSRAIDEKLRARLTRAACRVIAAAGSAPERIIVAGSGEFLARRAATEVAPSGSVVISLAETWGVAQSTAACARALVELVRDKE
jgi:probable H4MPT-linked C1 transfer pathway protein